MVVCLDQLLLLFFGPQCCVVYSITGSCRKKIYENFQDALYDNTSIAMIPWQHEQPQGTSEAPHPYLQYKQNEQVLQVLCTCDSEHWGTASTMHLGFIAKGAWQTVSRAKPLHGFRV